MSTKFSNSSNCGNATGLKKKKITACIVELPDRGPSVWSHSHQRAPYACRTAEQSGTLHPLSIAKCAVQRRIRGESEPVSRCTAHGTTCDNSRAVAREIGDMDALAVSKRWQAKNIRIYLFNNYNLYTLTALLKLF